MLKKLYTLRFIALPLLIDMLFFGLLNPIGSTSFIIVAGCVLLCLNLYVFWVLVLRAVASLLNPKYQISQKMPSLLTIVMMFLVLMQSIGQLSVRDIWTVIPLALILYGYAAYSSKPLATS